ncbi:protein FLX-like 2 isoform X2 [Impatiens glandulifera]|uniref:protein FLX-like 2 isoform X2 n=1 Tax=Impatiens glandulifera TaxID=253017 RepID=UPI001FB0EB62|nr:protein FLX-like 2 isoform X2 [Impatiens glandulifera]
MGSNGRPPYHRRPPPGMSHQEPFVSGIGGPAGVYLPYDISPAEAMEQKIAAQHVEMQKLVKENQRFAATHGTLRQELAAAQHELQVLQSDIGVMKSEKEHQTRNLVDKIVKMEAELQGAEAIKLELQKARTEAQNLVVARQELILKAEQLNQDLQRKHADLQQVSVLISERETLRQEYHHWRATYDYEKKLYNDHLESLQVMEKNYLNMAMEVEKLRAELTNIAGVDRRQVYGSSAMHNENEASGQHPVGQKTFEEGYNVNQAQVAPSGGAASVGAGAGALGTPHMTAQSGPNPSRASYDATKAPPNYDSQRGGGGSSLEAQRASGGGYETQAIIPPGGGYGGIQRGSSFGDAQRGHPYNVQRGGQQQYDPQSQRGGQQQYDPQSQRGGQQQYDPQSQRGGLSYDVDKTNGYDVAAAARGGGATNPPPPPQVGNHHPGGSWR